DFRLMSWDRIKKGYAAEEELYGASDYKTNRFARLATLAPDQAAALPAFLRLDHRWDKTTWHSRANFESARQWALAPPDDFFNGWKSGADHFREPGGAAYAKRFEADFHSSFDGAIKKCTEASKYDEGYFTLTLRVSSDGAIEQTIPWPPTTVARCLLPQVRGHRFAPPPQAAYWVIFSIGEAKPEPYVFVGVVFPDVGR